MDAEAVLAKTEKGREEINTRRYRLPLQLRFALILIDGRSTFGEVLAKGEGLPGLEETIEGLVQTGFAEVVGAEGARRAAPAAAAARAEASPAGAITGQSAKAELVQLATRLLGAQATKVVRKLEDAQPTTAGMSGAVDHCHKLIRLVIDERKAEAFLAEARTILSRL